MLDLDKNYLLRFDTPFGKVFTFETIKIIACDDNFVYFKDRTGKTSTYRLKDMVSSEEIQ